MAQHAEVDIDYVARLARLELTPEEKAKFRAQLGQVLEYFERINEVNVAGVEPLAHAFPVYNVWGEDRCVAAFTPDEALANAPARRDNQIVVPKVVEDA